MPDYVDLEEILRLNPHLDREELERSRAALRKLREGGRRNAGYRLAPPFAGRRVSVNGGGREDPRTIHLRQPAE